MNFHQNIKLPVVFRLGDNIVKDLKQILMEHHLNFRDIVVVSGSSFSNNIAKEILEHVSGYHYVVSNNSIETAEALHKYLDVNNIDLVIAVGGGKVQDVVKYAGFRARINQLIIPTIISSDGLISPIAVLKDENGLNRSIGVEMPLGVLIDYTIIQKSPKKYLNGAYGDLISNISALKDWDLAAKSKKVNLNDFAYQLSKNSIYSILSLKENDTYSKKIEVLVNGLVNSGIAMSLAGTSRPCSGAEHLLSHALDSLWPQNTYLHGVKVGLFSLVTLNLHDGEITKEFEQWMLRFNDNSDMFEEIENRIGIEVLLKTALTVRSGRFTILDTVTVDQFAKAWKKSKGIFTL